MKVLIFDTWSSSPQVEASLAITEKHHRQGDEVYYVNISQHLPFMEWYNRQGFQIRMLVRNKIHNVKKMTPVGVHFSTKIRVALRNEKLPKFNTIAELRDYEQNNIDYGVAVLSSLISRTRDLEPNLSEHNEILNRIYTSSVLAAESFQAWIKAVEPELVYIRNGRTALNRPLLRICQNQNINYLIHDRGCDRYHYSLNKTFRHDREAYLEDIVQTWNDGKHSDVEKTKIADEFYISRIKNKLQDLNFTENQTQKLLPDAWDSKKINITFFTGSITEFAAIDRKNSPETIFASQFDAIDKIAEYLHSKPDTQFYVRQHPNTTLSFPKENKTWDRFRKDTRLVFIDGASPVHSYTLAEKSDIIIAHMSTMGIEAAYMGKPSIVVGNSVYHRLGSNYAPESVEELFYLLNRKELPPLPKEGAIKYGYYNKLYGIKFDHFEPTSQHNGQYKGKDLSKPGLPLFLLHKANGLKKRVQKIFS